jgi:peptidyl-tRNA hydrolase, PTH2 family
MSDPTARTPPGVWQYVVATFILASLGGYFVGQGLELFGSGEARARTRRVGRALEGKAKSSDLSDAELSEGDGEDHSEGSGDDLGELKSFEESGDEECKLVLVVRTDLGMTKGELFSVTMRYGGFIS